MTTSNLTDSENAEIISEASFFAASCFEEAMKHVDYYMGDGKFEENGAITGAVILATAIFYQSARQLDAAEIIARAILEAAGKGVDHG